MSDSNSTDTGQGQGSARASDRPTALLEEYERCAEDMRNYDAMLYQIPSIGAVGLYVLAYLGGQDAGLPRAAVVIARIIGLVLMTALTFALLKQRYFQMARRQASLEIEQKLREGGFEVYGVPVTTREVARKGWTDVRVPLMRFLPVQRITAFDFLFWAMMALCVAAIGLVFEPFF
jgi:hypothetical protein